jgi:hypothetical protein
MKSIKIVIAIHLEPNIKTNLNATALVAQPTITYSYDAANRLTAITQAAGNTNGNIAQTISYAYDSANRLTKTTKHPLR